MNKLKNLEKKIEYNFKDSNKLVLALTHKSSTQNILESNQRLEFLGDSILGAIISAYLHNKFPKYNDGELTRLKSSLVKKETLAKLGKKLSLSKYLIKKENQTETTISMLEDTVEAIIGAIFIDSDFDTTQKIVVKLFEINFMDTIMSKKFLKQKNSATATLKEYSEKKYKSYPEVIFVKKDGKDNKPTFTMIVKMDKFIEKGAGKSKKEAIANASQKILNKINSL